MPQINNVFSRLKRLDSQAAKNQMERNITRAFGRNPDWPQGFGGGIFDGAGASGRFTYKPNNTTVFDYIRNTPIPIERSFSDAYTQARKNGLKTFIFNGKEYTTDYDPNAKLGNRESEITLANLRQVLDENKKEIPDSTRIEPWLGQIPGEHRRNKLLGGIYIKPQNRGKFTAWAEKHDMGVQEAANHILANKDDYSSTLVKRANFARNFSSRKRAALGTQYPLIGGVQPLNFTVPTFTPLTTISPLNTSGLTGNYRDLFNQNVRAGVLSTAISGLGRLGNYLAINSFKPKMQHTEVQAEQAEKAPTTYSINAQRDNLARSIAEGTRDINNNTASSQVAEARRSVLRNRGIGAFNSLYEGKLNRETEMLRADAQLRQGVRQRNTAALNNAVARDTATNTSVINNTNLMKKQALGNLFTGLSSDSINTINQLGNTYYNLLSNQQQLDRDIATASLYFLANRNAGNLFTPDENGNSIYDNVYNNVRRAWYGKLDGYNSLIRR